MEEKHPQTVSRKILRVSALDECSPGLLCVFPAAQNNLTPVKIGETEVVERLMLTSTV